MARTHSLTKVGRLTFVPAPPIQDCHQYNFERYRALIANPPAEWAQRCHYFGSLFWRAVENPNVPQFEYYSEFYDGTPNFGYEYEYVAMFDPEKMVMYYNRTICPHRDYHHLGTKCPVCGSD